jgi:hypothetical protein
MTTNDDRAEAAEDKGIAASLRRAFTHPPRSGVRSETSSGQRNSSRDLPLASQAREVLASVGLAGHNPPTVQYCRRLSFASARTSLPIQFYGVQFGCLTRGLLPHDLGSGRRIPRVRPIVGRGLWF